MCLKHVETGFTSINGMALTGGARHRARGACGPSRRAPAQTQHTFLPVSAPVH